MRYLWKRWGRSTGILIIVIVAVSALIAALTVYPFGDTLFVIGMLTLMLGLIYALRGNKRRSKSKADGSARTGGSLFGMERELEEIRAKGARTYAEENRTVTFTPDAIVMTAGGLITVALSYATLLL